MGMLSGLEQSRSRGRRRKRVSARKPAPGFTHRPQVASDRPSSVVRFGAPHPLALGSVLELASLKLGRQLAFFEPVSFGPVRRSDLFPLRASWGTASSTTVSVRASRSQSNCSVSGSRRVISARCIRLFLADAWLLPLDQPLNIGRMPNEDQHSHENRQSHRSGRLVRRQGIERGEGRGG